MPTEREAPASGWLSRPLARRDVLKGMGVAGTVLLSGHAAALNEILPAYGVEEVLTTADNEGLIKVAVKNGMILRVESLDHPTIEASPMGLNWHRRAYASDRVLYPMVRVDWQPGGGGNRDTRGEPRYRRVSWDEALDLVAGELQRVRDTYGNEALFAQSVGGWSTAGRLHSKGTLQRRLFSLFGGATRLVGNKSYATWQWGAPHHIGIQFPLHSMKDILDNGNLVIFWSADPVNTTRVSGATGAQKRWIKDLRRKGVKVIAIDPLFTETVELADQWIAPRPGSDGAIMAAIAHVMITEDLYDKDFIANYTVGFEPFRQYVMGETDGQAKTPEWAAGISDVSVETIRTLAMEYATTKGVLLATGWGMQRQDSGEHAGMMLPIALAAMKGELGTNGGGLGTYIWGGHGRPSAVGRGPRGISAAANPITQTLFEQHFAPALLNPPFTMDHNGTTYTYPEPGKSEVKLIHWVGGSSLNQNDDINMQLEAFKTLDTLIVQDSWWTAATRFADIVLPIATLFERNDFVQFGEYVVYQHQIIEPLGESRTDFEVFRDLADRLGLKAEYTEGKETEDAWLRELYTSSTDMPMSYDEFRQVGFHKFPTQDSPDIAASPFHAFRADPSGKPLGTPSGKIHIHSDVVEGFGYTDCPGTPQWIEPREWLGSAKATEYPLHLITKHPVWRRHSSYNNVDTLHKDAKVNGFEPVTINPIDATARGIVNGDVVRVFNDRGQILCGAHVTDAIRPQVVIVQQGSWYRPAEPGVANSLDRGGCANVLTRATGSSPLTHSPVAHSNLVQIEKYDGPVGPNDFAPIDPV